MSAARCGRLRPGADFLLSLIHSSGKRPAGAKCAGHNAAAGSSVQGFFLSRLGNAHLRKQRTRFFSRLSRNAPLKKKAHALVAAACCSNQRKGGKKAFFHNKLIVSSSASAGFFLKAPHSNVERTILCPLFSLHTQNQSVENKTLSSLPLHI